MPESRGQETEMGKGEKARTELSVWMNWAYWWSPRALFLWTPSEKSAEGSQDFPYSDGQLTSVCSSSLVEGGSTPTVLG